MQHVAVKRKPEAPLQTTPVKRGRKEKDKNKEKQTKDEGFAVVCFCLKNLNIVMTINRLKIFLLFLLMTIPVN